jgi:glutamate synthase domain-containing protein 3
VVGKRILDEWESCQSAFKKVIPTLYKSILEKQKTEAKPNAV